MQSKINLIFVFFLASALFADSFKYNNTNNHGIIGLINTPSARFLNEPSLAFTAYRGNPERKIVLKKSKVAYQIFASYNKSI